MDRIFFAAAEYIYNAYRDTKTCGVLERDPVYGITRIAEPIGIVAAVVPTTNPTSTAIFKALDQPENPERRGLFTPPPGQGLYQRSGQAGAGRGSCRRGSSAGSTSPVWK
ncbi:hypothetical protein AGMMS50268_20430 [Spirochaetia bacterium]|nr:hypothetical protein AGMMS50268_20430 [Spirochaetia bacterium]